MNERLIKSFAAIVGEENLRYSQAELLAYSYDATANFQAKPDIVISPRSTEEISDI